MNKPFILAIATAVLLSQPLSAQVENGHFTVNLDNWDTTGDVAVRVGAAFLTTADIGESPAKNFSGNVTVGSFGAFGLEGFVNLADGALDPDAPNSVFAFEGSALKQSATVLAGSSVTFQWRLLTDEVGGADYAFALIDDGVTPIFLTLANSSSASVAGIYSYSFSTSLNTYTSAVYAVNTPITISFGIVDVNDLTNASALIVDNVSIPEPTSMTLLGLAGLAYLIHRRRQS